MAEWIIRLLETPEEMTAVESLQRLVWPGSETDVIPAHMLLAAVHNGGLALGAFVGSDLVGVSFGFPGFYPTPDGPRLKHHSHILGVHPDWSGKGIGFALKRAQWQMVRKQGIDRITWTYDPLLSRNAHLNISRLGAVCNTYLRSEYGDDARWPERRPAFRPFPGGLVVEYRTRGTTSQPPLTPAPDHSTITALPGRLCWKRNRTGGMQACPPEKPAPLTGTLLLVEIPSDFPALKAADLPLARDWRILHP